MLYRLPWWRAGELLRLRAYEMREAAKPRDSQGRGLSLREQLMTRMKNRKGR